MRRRASRITGPVSIDPLRHAIDTKTDSNMTRHVPTALAPDIALELTPYQPLQWLTSDYSGHLG